MNIKNFLDSTYLKTAEQSNISEIQNKNNVVGVINEAINEGFKLVMIRPNYVTLAKEMIEKSKSSLTIGTVISFPEGSNTITEKLDEAEIAIKNGTDDLDFVINYKAFKNDEIDLVKTEVLQCTKLGIVNNKTVKWIIETAALNDTQIIKICTLIKNVVMSNFKESDFSSIFIKSSTGFFVTENNLPNGATLQSIIIMLENGSPLSIKASGGIKSYQEAISMIRLGVKRIGTSSAKAIANEEIGQSDY